MLVTGQGQIREARNMAMQRVRRSEFLPGGRHVRNACRPGAIIRHGCFKVSLPSVPACVFNILVHVS